MTFPRFFTLTLLAAGFLFAPALPAAAQTAPADTVMKAAEVPYREDAALISAEYYLATGKYAQALAAVEQVLSRHPQNADAYVYRAYAYEKLGDTAQARSNYQRAIAINAAHLGANKYLGSLYLSSGNLALAMEQLQALNYICAGTYCAEVDELQNEINAFKSKQ